MDETTKICRNCKHHRATYNDDKCGRLEEHHEGVDKVTGEPYSYFSDRKSCHSERLWDVDGGCGLDGKHFELKESVTSAPMSKWKEFLKFLKIKTT